MPTKNAITTQDINKQCLRCHSKFHCDVKEGCWCENVNLDQEALKKIRRDYIDCLCSTCLKQYESDKK